MRKTLQEQAAAAAEITAAAFMAMTPAEKERLAEIKRRNAKNRQKAQAMKHDRPFIETLGGGRFEFLDPKQDQIDIEHIAKSLAGTCRWNGLPDEHYSVAEHSCLQFDLAKERIIDKKMQRTILLHDAAEAYLQDCAAPIKGYMPDFLAMERGIMRAISERFDLYWPQPVVVRELDRRIVADEKAQLFPTSPNHWPSDDLEPLGVKLRFYNRARARRWFLQCWQECAPG